MAKPIETEPLNSSTARVPRVPPGKAIVFLRYDEEKAVVMNPQDFHRLVALAEALAEVASGRPEVTPLAVKAHRLEDEPGEPIEDPAAIKALLGL